MQIPRVVVAVFLLGVLGSTSRVDATWSIVLVNPETREVGIASVTCLGPFDLRAITPVVLVGVGAGAVQAAGDFDGSRRPIMRQQMLMGTDPVDILPLLAGIAGHQSRQYGIVDTLGGAMTFTGNQTFAWAGGETGQIDDYVYAVQGNILAGNCVVPAIINAMTNSTSDLPGRLMAGMQAARAAGGDGRCSCTQAAPTGCGCPPAQFLKSGHIGYFIVARIGDTNDPTCNANGCADGDYFLDLNVANQPITAPDPVTQLNQQFIAFRNARIGRPDAVQSITSFAIVGDVLRLTVELRDHNQNPITVPINSLVVQHANDSAGVSMIGVPTDLGGGIFTIDLDADSGFGFDRFRVDVDDGFDPVVLMPFPETCVGPALDCNANGVVDACEIADGTVEDVDGDGVPDLCFIRGDCDGSGQFEFADVFFSLAALFDPQAPALPCPDSCDANDDGTFDLADAIGTILALFGSGPALPAPQGSCGPDPVADTLSCGPTPCP